ncbi:MAG: histidine phosphatase family protein [bacterium]
MPRLILIRHAKSSWKTDAPTDHERPLNKRGRKDAPRVARHLADIGWTPDRVLCSDALRAIETWALMAPELDHPATTTHSRLYHAGVSEFQDVVRPVSTQIQTLAVVAHNPGLEAILSHLSGEFETLTTCNVALLESNAAKWHESGWTLVDVIRPRELA